MSAELKVLLFLAAFGWCLLRETHMLSLPQSDGYQCPDCRGEFCPKSEEECHHGRTRDPCECCPDGACILQEREKCFHAENGGDMFHSALARYSFCGENMLCAPRTDLGPTDLPESLCTCVAETPVCGADNVTYDSICAMQSSKIHLQHDGPCISRPIIASGPENGYAYEGGTLALDCEAKGFPVPRINWEFRSLTGSTAILPSDDPTVIVHSRGGPESYMVTSWLQIEVLRKNDSGTYTCVAQNSEGEDRSMTFVRVSAYSQ